MEFAVCPVSGARDWRPLRGSVRYPLHLRVTLLCDGDQNEAVTEDVSASGILLRLQEPLQVGKAIEFLLEVPAGALGFSATAAVHGSGRIVRSYWKHEQPYAAAVIDEYRFQ
ncbi:MAG TPA: PilZ domain-containing protein [Acidobacteriaceae bacterium]|nr:PilZ domain-containing protein [Acidobacteriaceae bacterium]